jgi:N4-gp56 family major capsid protein
MAFSEFGFLTPDQIKVWQRDVRTEWLRKSWLMTKLASKGVNTPIEIIDKLKKMPGGGTACVMSLVNRLAGDGGVGSMEGNREGNEEKMKSSYTQLHIDEIFNSVKHKGKLAAQNEVIDFRTEGRAALTDWMADRIDQLGMLTLSGIDYSFNLNGSKRGYYDSDGNYVLDPTWQNLQFAADVTAPSAKRHLMWDGVGGQLAMGDTSLITDASVPSYKALTHLKAYARTHRVKPMMAGGKEWYTYMTTPFALAMLKNDPDFKNAIIQGGIRGDENNFFTGGIPTIDGLVIQESDFVFNTTGANAGAKWGPDGNVDGARSLLLGAQALGFADLGEAEWVEKAFQYGAFPAIYTEKMLGFLKPQFYSTTDASVEDFGVVAFDHYTIGGNLAPVALV